MKFNLYFFIFLMFSIIAVFIDYLVYLTGITYWIALLISFVIVVGPIIYLIIKKKIKLEFNFDIYDLIFLSFLLSFTIVKIVFPDVSYDSINYHVYLQEAFNIQKLSSDFLVGSIRNTFLFPLGDRINYIFRYLLGYRMGTIFEYFSIVVIYYQVKKIIFKYINREKHERLFPCMFSSAFLISVLVRLFLGTYYIDMYSIIYPLEMLIIFLLEDNVFNNKKIVYLLFIYMGLATGIKLPNLLLIAPIVLYFFIKNIKKFNYKMIPHYLLGIILFIVPFILYLIDNQIQTESILFPYYNNLLKSRYFYLYSWKDPRFGIGGILEHILWPIYLIYSRMGYGDGSYYVDPIWCYGFIGLIIVFIVNLILRFTKNKRKCKYQDLINITLILNYVWIFFLEGYNRYAIIVLVLYLTVIAIFILDFNLLKKIYNVKVVKIYLGYIVILLSCTYFAVFVFMASLDGNYRKNISYLFKDNNYKMSFDYPIATAWDNSRLAVLLREEGTPIINIREDDMYNDKMLQVLNNYLDKYEYLYYIFDDQHYGMSMHTITDRFEVVEQKEYKIEDIPYLDVNETAYIYKIKKMEEKK